MLRMRPKPAPLFRFVAGAGPLLRRRIDSLRRGYRQRLALGAGFSIILHGLLGYSLRNIVEWPEIDQPIGLEGAVKLVDIQIVDLTLVEQEELARIRVESGALLAIDVETDDDVEEVEPEVETPVPRHDFLVFQAPPPVPQKPQTEPEPVRIEFREDFTVDPSSPEAARSDQFNPLRLIVPEYPERAFDRNIQGLVRLEAKVGISGHVLDVWVLEAPDSDLSLAAQRALLQWQFKPFMQGGRPTQFRIVIPFRFRIVE